MDINGYKLAMNKFISEVRRLFLIKRVKLAHPPYNNGYLPSAERLSHFSGTKKKGKEATNLE